MPIRYVPTIAVVGCEADGIYVAQAMEGIERVQFEAIQYPDPQPLLDIFNKSNNVEALIATLGPYYNRDGLLPGYERLFQRTRNFGIPKAILSELKEARHYTGGHRDKVISTKDVDEIPQLVSRWLLHLGLDDEV